ncbi:hypothetical protein FGIG_12460, partial [Fasciola gigantica]
PPQFKGIRLFIRNCLTTKSDINPRNQIQICGPGRPTCSYLGPETTAPYALDEPHLPAALILSVQGGLSSVYDMNQVGFGKTLIYDNFIYLTVFGPLSDSWTESARRDSLSCDLVFDVVPGSQRVIYSSKTQSSDESTNFT